MVQYILFLISEWCHIYQKRYMIIIIHYFEWLHGSKIDNLFSFIKNIVSQHLNFSHKNNLRITGMYAIHIEPLFWSHDHHVQLVTRPQHSFGHMTIFLWLHVLPYSLGYVLTMFIWSQYHVHLVTYPLH